MQTKEIEIRKIKGNPYQTRLHMEEEPLKILAKSIRERGLFNPITLLKRSENEYIIVHGHRRLRAFKKLHRKTIPSFVKSRNKEHSLMIDLIHENLVREDLSVQEKALSIKLLFSQIKNIKDDLNQITSCITGVKLYKFRGPRKKEGKGAAGRRGVRWTDNDMFMAMKLLKTIGMSENTAISYLNILKLPERIQRRVYFNVSNAERDSTTNKISIRLANELARVEDTEFRDYLLEKAFKGSSAMTINGLVNHYLTKVLRGEWKGFERPRNNFSVIKIYNKDLFVEVGNSCNHLSAKLNTFRLTKIMPLAEIMEKEVFISAAKNLRRQMKNMDNRIKLLLKSKGYVNVEKYPKNEVFELHVQENKLRKTCRGNIPKRILIRLGVKKGDFVQVKIVGVKK